MRKEIKQKIFALLITMFVIPFSMMGQIGINTNTPQGILDVSSSNQGIVYPIVDLVDVYTETCLNPNALETSILEGTMVYNTNTTNAGIDSIYPGIYIWTGSKWIPQFNKKDSQLFVQDSNLRTRSNSGDQDIQFSNGATSSTNPSFTPKFNGPYRITVTVNYGGGELRTPGGKFTDFAAASGEFDFDFDGTVTTFNQKAYSGFNNDRLFKGGTSASRIDYTNSVNQAVYTIEETLSRTNTYNFSLSFNQDPLSNFISNGNSGDGRGFIRIDGLIRCTVEITYVGD